MVQPVKQWIDISVVQLFENILPGEVIHKIANYPPPSILLNDDEYFWGATPDGSFTTKSATITQMGFHTSTPGTNFNYIWKWKGNERIQTSLWKLGHEIMFTNVERHRRMMATSKLCPIRDAGGETILHQFRDCHTSFAIWNCLKVRK